MIMRKFLTLAFGASLLALQACDTTDTGGSPSISGFGIANFDEASDSLRQGQSVTLFGDVRDDIGITDLYVRVMRGADSVDVIHFNRSAFNNRTSLDLENDLSAMVTIVEWRAGQYTLVLVARDADGNMAQASVPLRVATATTSGAVTFRQVTMGAQGAAPPSAIDLDQMLTFSSAASLPAANQALVDLVLGFHESQMRLYSPATIPTGFGPASWTTRNTTTLHTTTLTVAQFDAITTQAAVDAAFAAGAAVTGGFVTATAGTVFAARTGAGRTVLVHVSAVSAVSRTGTITIRGTLGDTEITH